MAILITENIFLGLFLVVWLNRECRKCNKTKEITRIMNKNCERCKGNGKDDKVSKKEKAEFL